MIDQKTLYEKQISEFFCEYKNRFTAIPMNGIQGKCGYSAKLNRIDVNCSVQMYFYPLLYYFFFRFIPERFPLEPPFFFAIPPFQHTIIEQSGRIIDDCLKRWNVQSTLKNCVAEILSKLENSQQPGKPQNNVQDIMKDDDSLSKELRDDLNKKSVEELLYIYHNPEHYIKILTHIKRNENDYLFNEVLNQSKAFYEKKNQYEIFKKTLDDSKKQYDELEAKLNDLYVQKAQIDSKYTVEMLIEEMRKHIDESYSKPKARLVNDLMSKKITFDQFQNEFQTLSMKFHYYSIIKDKMNLFK